MHKRLEERVNTYGAYLKRLYGRRMFRVGLSINRACPHRERSGGCIFCLPETYTDNIRMEQKSPEEQLDILIPKIRKGCGDVGLLAYFQHDTSTAAPGTELKQIFEDTLKHSEINGLIISTRPDHLDEEIVKMLNTLQGDLFLEIGLQSIHQKSLDYLERGHTVKDSAEALRLCEEYGIKTGAHLILGIPGETEEDMLATIDYLNDRQNVSEIKFHNLVVYKGTKLASKLNDLNEYSTDPDAYISLLGRMLQHTNGDKVISRFFTSNLSRSNLTLNPFPGLKRGWMNRLTAWLDENDITQGSKTAKPFIPMN